MILIVREERQVSEHTFNAGMDDHTFKPGARRKWIYGMLSEHRKNTSMSRFHTERVRMMTDFITLVLLLL